MFFNELTAQMDSCVFFFVPQFFSINKHRVSLYNNNDDDDRVKERT